MVLQTQPTLEQSRPLQVPTEPGKMNPRISALAEAVLAGEHIDAQSALYLLTLGPIDTYDLFYWANRIRLAFLGAAVSFCSIISAHTGRCSQDCRFCAQSAHHDADVQPRYAEPKSIVEAARTAIRAGAHCFGIVSSGREPSDEQIDSYADAIAEVVEIGKVQCCASLGCLTSQQARRLAELGVIRYNHNLETSERYFPQVVTTHSYADRVATVRAVKAAGIQVCCGGIIGMGETLQDRVDLAMQLCELDVDSIPLNFLHPIPGTPFAQMEPIQPISALQTIAMFRFVLPTKPIKVAGGREHCLRDLQSWMFFAGASSCMIGNYLTTEGRAASDDLQMLADLALPLG